MTTLTEAAARRLGSRSRLLERVLEGLRQAAERRVAFFYEQPWKT